MTICVTAVVYPAEGQQDKALGWLQDLLKEVKSKEKGCLKYELYKEAKKGGVITLHEEYADQAAWDAHTASEDFNKLKKQAGDNPQVFTKGFDIFVTEKVDGFTR